MPVPHHSVFTGRMPFLPPNQQRQSTESKEQEQECEILKKESQPVRIPSYGEFQGYRLPMEGATDWQTQTAAMLTF